jgi:outer membrane receptor for ferrienterochelin and colicins
MKKLFLFVVALFIADILSAQYSFKAIIKSEEANEPLPGTTVFIKGGNKFTVADSTGLVIIKDIAAGRYSFVFTHIGFKKKEIEYSTSVFSDKPVTITMESDKEQLGEIVIQTTRSGHNLSEVPTRIEVIAPDELDEKGTMKPGDIRMLLNESTGITTQQTSAVSGTANIRIQGLDGRYTQLLKDGMPLYTGFSAGLSILQIPPLDLQQVEYIKGSASTLYGAGAIAGLVNLITKTPGKKKELNFLINGNTGKGFDTNGFYSEKWNKAGLTIFGSYNYNGPYDPAGIGFTAIPTIKRVTINPKIFFYFNKKTTAWFGVNTSFENRFGGDQQVVNGKADSIHQYFELNKTNRVSTQFNLTHIINEFSRINIKNAVGIFERSLSIPGTNFNGEQISTFSEINYAYKKRKSEWIIGMNEWTEKFTPQSTTQLTYQLTTIGIFGQHTFKANNWFSIESGLRLDKSNPSTKEKLNGSFILPRINALFKFNNFLSSRIGGGLGYKMPTPFIDDAEKIAYQHIRNIDFAKLSAEKSFGTNADINFRKQFDQIKISINQFFFYTKLNKPVLLVNNDFVNASGYTDTKGAETNFKITVNEVSMYVGYTYTDTRQHYNGHNNWQPLSARNRINFDLTYEIENSFRFGAESFYTGRQLLSNGNTGKAYITFGLLVQKMWKRFDLFINVENLTDIRQTRWGNIYTGSVTNPEFNDIYTPLEGIIINTGIKIKCK